MKLIMIMVITVIKLVAISDKKVPITETVSCSIDTVKTGRPRKMTKALQLDSGSPITLIPIVNRRKLKEQIHLCTINKIFYFDVTLTCFQCDNHPKKIIKFQCAIHVFLVFYSQYSVCHSLFTYVTSYDITLASYFQILHMLQIRFYDTHRRYL